MELFYILGNVDFYLHVLTLFLYCHIMRMLDVINFTADLSADAMRSFCVSGRQVGPESTCREKLEKTIILYTKVVSCYYLIINDEC